MVFLNVFANVFVRERVGITSKGGSEGLDRV